MPDNETKPTEEQMKEAEAQFDKLSPTEMVRLGKRVATMLSAGGARNAMTMMLEMPKIMGKLKKLKKKAEKAEAKKDYESARKYGNQILEILNAQKGKMLGPEVSEMFSMAEENVKKSIENVNAMKNLEEKNGE